MSSQAEPVGPADVVKVLQWGVKRDLKYEADNLSFLNNSLLEENLSEHADSERKELIKLLDNLVYRLNQESPDNFSGKPTSKEGRSFSIMKIIAEKASTINKKILDHTSTIVEKNPDKIETEVETSRNKVSLERFQNLSDKASSINLSKKIHDHSNEEKSLDKAESQEPIEQTTDVAPVADDIDDTEYELPPGLTGSLSLESESSTTSSLRSTLTFDEFKRRLKANQGFTVSELKPLALFSGNLLKHKKKKIIGTGWYPRYCVLVQQFLFYFKSESEEREKGFIVLPWFKLSTKVKEKGFCFTLDPLEKGNAGYTFQSDTKEEYEKWKTHVESTVNKALTEDEEDLLNSLQEANIGNADEQNETEAKVEGIDNKAVDAANPQSSASSVEEEVKNLQGNRTAFSEDNIYMGLYDCRGEDDGDLSFKAGDILYILNKVDTSWWLAYGNGKCGLVPNNYLTGAFS